MSEIVPLNIDKPIPFVNLLSKLTNGINSETGEVVCKCQRTKGLYLFNKNTKEIKFLKCKSYSCEYCGAIKVRRFRDALNKYLGTWDFVRMFTFTQHTPDALCRRQQNANIAKAWAHFVKNVRRDKSLSESRRNFQYVKIVEFTQRGYIHYHVVINTYLPIKKLRYHWNNALFHVFKWIGGRGGINIKTTCTAKSCVSYLTKYLSKMTSQEFGSIRRWSKSGKVALFEVFISDKSWIFFRQTGNGLLNLNNKSVIIQFMHQKIDLSTRKPPEEARLLGILNYYFFGIE